MTPVRLLVIAALTFAITPMALADFDGEYAPGNWSFYTDSSGTGTLDALEMHLLGIDDGSLGYTEYYITADVTATVTFDWEFLTDDTTGNEFAFFAIDFSEQTLANAGGQSGSFSQVIYDGDVFELGVYTTNGTHGPGELRITNFVFPEPSSLALLAVGALALRRR